MAIVLMLEYQAKPGLQTPQLIRIIWEDGNES
jgi:hypothetical protein